VIPLFREACRPLPAEPRFSFMIAAISIWQISKSDNTNAASKHVKQQSEKK
jgi:hypothetical protein